LKVISPSSTSLTWSNLSGDCELADLDLNIVQTDFVSGSITTNGFIQNIDRFICVGDSFSLGNQVFYQTGNYTVITGRNNHCDSIVNINLRTLDRSLFNSDTVYSCLDSLNLSAQIGFSSYVWMNGQTGSSSVIRQSGWQVCSALLASCSVVDSIFVQLNLSNSNILTIQSNGSTLCPGSSLQLSASIRLPDFTYVWKLNGQVWQTHSSNSIYPTLSQAGTYSLLAYRADGCSILSNVLNINSQNCNSISGQLTYNNNIQTPLQNATVRLLNTNNQVISTNVTTNTGQFNFSGFSNDTYTYSLSVPYSWGGVNATDALGITRFATALITLSPLRRAAGDVNLNNSVNSTDALLINRRYANLINSFSAGNFAFVSPTTITTGIPLTQNLQTVCFGDINGSYNPIFQPRKSFASLDNLDVNETIINNYLLQNLIPVYLDQELDVSAVSLVLKVPQGLNIDGVVFNSPENKEDAVFNQIGNEIRIAWHSLAYWQCSNRTPLFWLVVNSASSVKPLFSFESNGLETIPLIIELESTESELANNVAEAYSDFKLLIPSLRMNSELEFQHSFFPNPSNGLIYFNGPYDFMEIQDNLGRIVMKINKQPKMNSFDLQHLAEGVYFIKVHNGFKHKIDIVTINKSFSR
ncbi:MAG: T9SS type A sorting domain-containing protein, partial [Bacteroidetes bacterium]|nr:T9SS type A sorting domain-containing protein [Bacteroidota bacterium]